MATTDPPTNNDIYGGKDPRDIPAYGVGEAAYYLRVNQGTLRAWIAGQPYSTSAGPRRSKPVIRVARAKPFGLSFYNLIEVHVLRALRQREEIPLQRIRPALDYVEREMGVKHPLVNQNFVTDGLNLFVERYGHLINATEGGRIAMKKAIEATLHRIDRDDEGLASRFFLWAGDPLEERKVSVDPRVSFGRAVIVDTGVPISVLAERALAGDTSKEIATDYGLNEEDVDTALQWEPRAKAA